jgi:ADP-ribose pyrophosphatase YjhB (NUDIX family)
MSTYMAGIRARIGNRMIEIPSASVLTFDENDRVLLVKHADFEQWTTPGGAIEPEESPADAAVREMYEETGLHVQLQGVLGVYGGPQFTGTYPNGDNVSFLMVVFEGTRIGGTPRPDLEETLEVRYFARSEIEDLDTQPWVDEVLENAWSQAARPYFSQPSWTPDSEQS